jgi:hypothetical protein
LETPEDGMGEKLLMLFNKLTDDEKRSVFGIVQSMSKK